eukprot:scaffold232893_cov30-Tisochrysis_lutea.AAC.7
MRRSKAAVSFICRSGDEACDGAGIVSAVSQRASAREKAGRAEGVSHVRSATVVSAILQTGKCSKECMSYALYNMKRHVHTCCWIIDCFHEAKKLGLERIKARSGPRQVVRRRAPAHAPGAQQGPPESRIRKSCWHRWPKKGPD